MAKSTFVDLKAKHFDNTVYHSGHGPIENYSLETYPGKPAFQGVEMSRIGGKRYYHIQYTKSIFITEKLMASISDPETIIRTIELTEE